MFGVENVITISFGFNRFWKVFWTDGSSGRMQIVVISLALTISWTYSRRTDRRDGSKVLLFHWF